ncbi:MAG: ribosomal protein S18-alanine N-acetyltransferase [Dictyoglomaceae bacterium]|nr:ribosomal protein S18-alanine N-acetyltransferase [Dictyoglomaceae bacterium]
MILKIREFNLKDLDGVLEIEKLSFPKDAYSKSLFKGFYKIFPEGFFVAEIDNKIVGYIFGYIHNDRGEIVSISVHPSYRRLGIGRKLMKTLLSIFIKKGVKKCFLQVRVSNISAIEFYKKLEFKILNRVIKYYIDEDAYLMEKDL